MSNLITHLKQVHSDYQLTLQDAGGMTAIGFCASAKSTSIFKYLRFIVVNHQPFSVVESDAFRSLCSLPPITYETIVNYMTKVSDIQDVLLIISFNYTLVCSPLLVMYA
jgi:hypothetical protein